jgi:signal transduction histidine kinase
VEVREIAVKLKSSAGKLYQLLEKLLEWTMLQRGKVNFNPESISLVETVYDCLDLTRAAAEGKGITIEWDGAADLQVKADRRMLESLIHNVLSNSIKFTKRDGKVSVSAWKRPDQRVEMAIRDTGIGMSKERIDRLFQLEMLPSRTGTEGEASTGLGLLLCKEYVGKHGGEIWAESAEGKGSTFHFTLPPA